MAWRIGGARRAFKKNNHFFSSSLEANPDPFRSSLPPSPVNSVLGTSPVNSLTQEKQPTTLSSSTHIDNPLYRLFTENASSPSLASKQFGWDSTSQGGSIYSRKDVQFFHSSSFSASPPTSSSAVERMEAEEAAATVEDADILRTEDCRVLYSRTPSPELLRTLFNLLLVAYEPMVDLSIAVLKSPLMDRSFFRVPTLWMVKNSVYEHFCAGENVAEASKTLQRMWEQGLQGILDYSLEDAIDNISCDENLRGFVNTIQTTRELPQGSVSSACVKITAIAPLTLLERVSELLRWQHKTPGFLLPWKQDSLPFLSSNSPNYHVQAEPSPLSTEEETDLLLAHERLDRLCKACEEANLPLLVDAEYSSVQPAIDYLTYAVALNYNRQGSPLVFTTIQTYLKDALPRLSLALEASSQRGMAFGVKLVRGAYISRENALASALQAPSPIHSSIQKTHHCYDSCAAMMLENLSAGKGAGAVVLATHNFQSGRVAACKAQELGLVKGDSRLQFAQLKGMADGLSLALAHAGFQVSKYLPFGPVQQVIPYLIRRAEENRGLLGNAVGDRNRVRTELRRRLYAAIGL
ncbi:hypothetical protein O6H91_04G088700 [Diphasiastrum complanatum]|uniref:Uncharacterized protein n=1 Tax=Diphasiastrum complanatum TaxID=34168 RepID=A0ACC2DZ35_DIPCM|nr:hypothetical protein O6H91_04G088700 [Diphasiastrum complanatum]